MKFFIALKVLSSCQGHSGHLSMYVQIKLSERGSLQYAEMRFGRRTISQSNCGQSSGITVDVSCNGKRRDSHKSVLQK